MSFSTEASGLIVKVDESGCFVMSWEGVQASWSHTVTNVDALVNALNEAKASVSNG